MSTRDSDVLEKQELLSNPRDENSEYSDACGSDVDYNDGDTLPSSNLWRITSLQLRKRSSHSPFRLSQSAKSLHCRRRSFHLFIRILTWIPTLIFLALIICATCFPSYSRPPPRYLELRRQVEASTTTGSANPNHEKVFIVASLSDNNGKLLSGHWSASVRRLVDIIGADNAFVSVYENDADDASQRAMRSFADSLPCESSLVAEHLDLSQLPHLHLADGLDRLKRIAFLAEVRNRALNPLDDPSSTASSTRWDKVLYLNDVAFDPLDAANLLFNTNIDETTGRTSYRAACAVDFINPFKFYDTYATRDLEGYEMGVPFYPWFTHAGHGASRRDVLKQKDAVRVKSCWGGMVAFEGKWFQPQMYEIADGQLVIPTNNKSDSVSSHHSRYANFSQPSTNPGALRPAPLRFRYEPDTYWDASECCLIQADLTHLSSPSSSPRQQDGHGHTGIYMNPYIRVAYSPSVRAWLGFTRRFERLYTPFHRLLNALVGKPGRNPRRLQRPGSLVEDRVWVNNGQGDGSFEWVQRVATPGRFCGMRKLSYIRDSPDKSGKTWATIKAPRLPE